MASTVLEFIPDFDQLDQDIQDEDFQAEVEMSGQAGPGGGGGLSPSQQDQQESIVAGGVSKGIVAAGIFGALLSQLESVAAIVSAVLGAISRALIPTVEIIADLLRPVIEGINQFISDPGGTVNRTLGFDAVENGLLGGLLQSQGFGATGEGLEQGAAAGPAGQLAAGAIGLGIDIGSDVIQPPEPDQSDEVKKSQTADKYNDAVGDKLGGRE